MENPSAADQELTTTDCAKLKSCETVLINSATGIAERLAVQIARYRGTKKVIAPPERILEALRQPETLGANFTIPQLASSWGRPNCSLQSRTWRRRLNLGPDAVLPVGRLSCTDRHGHVLPCCDGVGAKFSMICGGEMSVVKKEEIGDLAMD